MSKWKEIRNDYCDEDEGKVYIDAWKTRSGDEEGRVIAKVDYKTKKVEYLDETAETDSYAQEIISEVLEKIDNGYYKNCPVEKLYEDENGYVYPCRDGYRVHWKNKKFKPDVGITFSKHWEAYYYLRSVNK